MLEPSERLRNAIIEGNLSITKRMLFKFPELWLNINTTNGWNNLHYSSYKGNYLICFHLISFINQFKDENAELASILSNRNDMLSFDKISPIHLTIKNSHLQTLHYLLQEFPGVYWLNHKGGKNQQTPLHFCCIYGFNEGSKLLLEKGADYNILDKNGNNMLHLAFEYGNFECISTFVEFLYNLSPNKAANLKLIKTFENSKNNNGWLPIELSVNFKLTRYYASFKDKLTSSSSNSNSDLDESISRGSYGTSSFKDSSSMLAEIPFVLGSDTRSNLRLEPDSSFSIDSSKSTTNGSPSPNKILASPIISVNEFNKRSHSQSLPTQSEEDIYSALRQRANTTLTPVALPLIPPTPSVIKKIPSLKSITISPSMRLDTEVDPIGIESSSSSTTTTSNSSPIKTTFPSIKTTSVKTDVKSSRTRSDSSAANEDTALVNSPSSIAAKIAFNSSKSSAASSRKNSNPEPSPVRLQNSNSNSQMRRDSSSSPLSHQNLQSPGSKQHLSPSKHKNSINSISFSRVR